MSWALSQQIVTSAPARHVLLCLANYADHDGKTAFPSVARLERDTGLSERTIRSKLRELEDLGVLVRGNQSVVEAYVSRGDRLPICYDIITKRGANAAPRAERGAGDSGTGCISRSNGVQEIPERGAGGAGKPSLKPPDKPSRTERPKSWKLFFTEYPENKKGGRDETAWKKAKSLNLTENDFDLMLFDIKKRRGLMPTWFSTFAPGICKYLEDHYWKTPVIPENPEDLPFPVFLNEQQKANWGGLIRYIQEHGLDFPIPSKGENYDAYYDKLKRFAKSKQAVTRRAP